MRRRALLYPAACQRWWATRCKCPNPQLPLQHQSPPITLRPHDMGDGVRDGEKNDALTTRRTARKRAG